MCTVNINFWEKAGKSLPAEIPHNFRYGNFIKALVI